MLNKLSRRTATIYGIAFLVLAAACWTTAGHFMTARTPFDQFPTKLDEEVFVPGKDGKKITYIRYKVEDGVRYKASGVVFYDQANDGIIDYLTFDRKGYIVKSEKFFPKVDAQEEAGMLRRLALYEADGSLFKKHIVNRHDGTLERSGERLRDGRYHIRYYFTDGVTVERERFFTSNLVLSFERTYRNDGEHTTASETRLISSEADKEYAKTFYNDRGIKVARITKSPIVGTKGEVFNETGDKVVASYEKTPWTTQEAYFREDGSVEQSRLSYANSTTAVVFGGEKNWVQYKQTWRSRPPVDGKPARFILTRVVEFDANQVELRTIEMVNDGTRPSYVSIPLAGKSRLYKILDDKGYVVRSEIKEGDALISSESPAVTELISFEKRLFLHDNPVEIPNYDFYEAGAPAWIYDYEDTQYPRMKPN